jgi:Kef-type K+ transport system membrane component KefB
MITFFVAAWFLGGKYIPRLLAFSETLPTSQPLMAMVLAIAFLMAWGAEWIGSIAFITGSYLAGLLVAQTHYKHMVEERISSLTYSMFVPVFFINIGLSADATPLLAPFAALLHGQAPSWGPFIYTIISCAVAVVAKVAGCYLGCIPNGFNPKESLRVGVGMVSRGEVGLIIANIGLVAGIIDTTLFSIMVVMVLVTTLVTPPALKMVFPDEHQPGGDDVSRGMENIMDELGIESVVGSPASSHEDPYREKMHPDGE